VAEALSDPTGVVHSRSLLAVFGATFFVRFAFGITLAVFATYIIGHLTGVSATEEGTIGLVAAMAPIGEFTTVLLSGLVTDRIGRFPVLFSGMGGAAVLFGVVAVTRSVLALGALNFFFGVASGAILASSLTVVADRSTVDERGLEMGRFDAMNLAGWLGGYAFGIAILGFLQNGWLSIGFLPYVFVIGALILLGGLAFARYLVRGLPRTGAVRGQPVSGILRHAFSRGVLLVTTPWLVIYMLIGYILIFVGGAGPSVGIPDTYIAAGIGAGGAILVVSQPQFGRLADRFGRTLLMNVGVVGFVGVMLFASLAIAYPKVWELLIPLGVLVVPALGYGPAALASLADLAHALSRGTTMAIYSLTISLGMILGLVVGTQLVAHLGDLGLYLFFGGIAAALVILTGFRHLEFREPQPAVPTTPAR
jgi:MFS family permease